MLTSQLQFSYRLVILYRFTDIPNSTTAMSSLLSPPPNITNHTQCNDIVMTDRE